MSKELRFPTAVGALDLALGGGVPVGKASLIYGMPNCGKTTLLGLLIASFQRQFPELAVLELETEDKWDAGYYAGQGVDLQRIHLERVYYLAETLNLILDVARNKENHWGEIGLVVLDSLGGLVSQQRIEEVVEEQMFPPEPKAIGQFIRQMSAEQRRRRYAGNPLTLLMTNHERRGMAKVGPPPVIIPGGEEQKFMTAVRIRLRRPDYLEEVTTQGLKRALCIEIPFHIDKNFGGPAGDSGSFRIFQVPRPPFNPGQVDDLEFWWNWGQKVGYIDGRGKSWALGERNGFGGKLEILSFWRGDLTEYDKDKAAILPLAIEELKRLQPLEKKKRKGET